MPFIITFILLQDNHSIWTDWIQAIGALITLPIAFFSIYKLFKKDTDKQSQLDSLKSMAASQSQHIQELSNQTQELKNQTEIQREFNDLFREQNSALRDIILYDKDEKKALADIEKKKYLLSIRPQFILTNAGSGTSGNTSYVITCKKNTAIYMGLELDNQEYFNSQVQKRPGVTINENEPIQVNVANNLKIPNIQYSLIIKLTDQEGNKYNLEVSGRYNTYCLLQDIRIELKQVEQ